MPHFHPPVPPRFLLERMRDAEREVWQAFQQLDHSWHVFYSARANSESGWDREVDFVLIRLNCIFYCEVKGGIVIVDQRAGAGVTWAHKKRSGELLRKCVDSTQLWRAKRELGATIRQIAGATPRYLGFREHDVYIFPHTPKEVTLGGDLERGNVHYMFAGDIADLSARLQYIVGAGKGIFIDRDRIEEIIAALDGMVIKNSVGTLPRMGPEERGFRATAPYNNREAARGSFIRGDTGYFRLHRQGGRQAVRLFWAVAVLLGIFGMLGIAMDMPGTPGVSNAASRPVATLISKPATKPTAATAMTELPDFIAPASMGEVEQAIAKAQDPDVYVSWQSKSQNGLVRLLADEGNGCRRYQVSRHDVHPAIYGFVRRCI